MASALAPVIMRNHSSEAPGRGTAGAVTPSSHQYTINQARIFPLPRSTGFAASSSQSLFSLLLISN